MKKYLATTMFGLESILKQELKFLNFNIINVSDGKIIFEGDDRTPAKTAMFLRTAGRIYEILSDEFCNDFDTYFDLVINVPWEDIIRKNRFVYTKGETTNSKISSVPVIQSMGKKAIIKRLLEKWNIDRISESEGETNITFSFEKDRLQILLDVCGRSLHKRGYRVGKVEAPVRETLAAGICELAYVKDVNKVIDPFCGSGTLLIEYYMMKRRIAPGLITHKRNFLSDYINESDYNLFIEEAKSRIVEADCDFVGYDIDSNALDAFRKNLTKAGFTDDIIVARKDFMKYNIENDRNLVICNPPYGERIGKEEDLVEIYGKLEEMFTYSNNLLFAVYTGYDKFRIRNSQVKNRKLFNGKIKSYLYLKK
ncbi:MAG: hypothetical protein JXR48_02815 [Candidatus Delongbacteria bacterium]|nr:hypothetical protein [Candidatus Delongbacteria bacterium]MBN2833879.1 hypothetical protein [Candidatus Delongbacteria bacterium]